VGIQSELRRVVAVDTHAFLHEAFLFDTMRCEPVVEYGAATLAIQRVHHKAIGDLAIPAKLGVPKIGDRAQPALHIGSLIIERVIEVEDENHSESGTMYDYVGGNANLTNFAGNAVEWVLANVRA